MLDGIKASAKSKQSTKELEKELRKDIGEEGFYLEKDRMYRDENDVFEHYTMEERNIRFSVRPATVYENMQNLENYKTKLETLKQGDVFTDAIIDSFKVGAIKKWSKELRNRIIDESIDSIRSYTKLHEKENMDALDEVMWNSIDDIKYNVMKDTLTKKSLFTQIKDALDNNDYEKASNLQLELKHNMEEIQQLYIKYKKNIY